MKIKNTSAKKNFLQMASLRKKKSTDSNGNIVNHTAFLNETAEGFFKRRSKGA